MLIMKNKKRIKIKEINGSRKGRKPYPENRLVVVLVDYDNVSITATSELKVVDWDKLTKEIAQLGEIFLKFIIVPYNAIENRRLPNHIHNAGWVVLPVPSTNGKDKDRVDQTIIKMGTKFANLGSITDIVIVGHDGDYCDLVSAINDIPRKRITIVSDEHLSYILKEVVRADNYKKIPLKKLK